MPRSQPKTASLRFEQALWDGGIRHVYGLDEVGRGAWAGPVFAAAVCLPSDVSDWATRLIGVNDSKQVSPANRAVLCECIQSCGCIYGVGQASAAEIDAIGIMPATRLAMNRAMDASLISPGVHQPEHFLLDAIRWNWNNRPYTSLIRGDSQSLSIAAASILAKVHRDAFMAALDPLFPGYGFARHKGYGTSAHQTALGQLGPSYAHRMSFAPLAQRLI